jgi:copper transport protein
VGAAFVAGRRSRIPRLLPAAIGLLLAAALLAPAAPVMAHAFLVQTNPRAGERLASPPPGVQLRFSEPVVSGSLEVRGADGTAVGHDTARRAQGGLVVETVLPDLDDGIYVVAYEVVAEDTHVTAGEFAFAVGDVGEAALGAAAAATPQEDGIGWTQALARGLMMAGLLLAVGGLMSERFVWRPVGSGQPLPRLPVGWLLAVAALGTGGSLVTLLFGGAGPDGGEVQQRLLSVPALAGGTQLVLLGVAGQLLMLAPLRSWVLLPLAAALGLASLTGHPASQGAIPMTANLIHLAAVALWTGGLLHLALVVWRFRHTTDLGWLRRGAVRYASAALAVVAVVALSGLVLAFAQFRGPAELIDTTYGRLLVAKSALVVFALGLALLARLRGLGRGRPLRPGLLARVTRVEALALVGTLAVATLLASATPPSAVRGAAYLLGPPPLEGPVLRSADLAGSMAVHLAAAPGRLELRALGFSGEGIEGAELRLTGERPDGIGIDLQPRDCGPGCWTTALSWPTGTTTLRADVSAPSWTHGSVEFSVRWPPQSEAPERLEAVLDAMRAQPVVVMTEQVSSGPGMTGEAHTFRRSGGEFARDELYTAGGATDIHPVPPRVGESALTLYLPGSAIWFRLELDARDRIVAETIVSPGHLIERTFSYPEERGAGRPPGEMAAVPTSLVVAGGDVIQSAQRGGG